MRIPALLDDRISPHCRAGIGAKADHIIVPTDGLIRATLKLLRRERCALVPIPEDGVVTDRNSKEKPHG